MVILVNNVLAIIKDDSKDMFKDLTISLKKYNISMFSTSNIIEGLNYLIYNRPTFLILDDEKKGYTLSKIILEMLKGYPNVVYLLVNLENTSFNKCKDCGIDFLIKKPINLELIELELTTYISKQNLLNDTFTPEMQRARDKQEMLLPKFIDNEEISIRYISSPFKQLSGDYLKLFTKPDEPKNYYGILFDCAGHDLLAWQQTGIVETTFNYAIRFFKQGIYKSLPQIMTEVSNNMLPNEIFVAAVIFRIDLEKRELSYVSAGLPGFFIKEDGTYKKINLCGKLIGYAFDTPYKENILSLKNIDNIIIPTDGISDMLKIKEDKKQDDASAFFIQLKH